MFVAEDASLELSLRELIDFVGLRLALSVAAEGEGRGELRAYETDPRPGRPREPATLFVVRARDGRVLALDVDGPMTALLGIALGETTMEALSAMGLTREALGAARARLMKLGVPGLEDVLG